MYYTFPFASSSADKTIDWSAKGKFALLQAIAQALLVPLAAAVLPRLTLIFFRYMQSFLIDRVSRFVTQSVVSRSNCTVKEL